MKSGSLPTAVQPFKHGGPQASRCRTHRNAAARHRIVRNRIQRAGASQLARAGLNPQLNWRVCTLEIDRGGYSYTVDTLRQLHEELPEASCSS